jgi:uncharacterized membrane protein YbhN (UPF0104 family)
VLRRLPGTAGGRVESAAVAFSSGLGVMRDGRLLAAALALSVAAWLVEASMYYLIGLAFPLRVGPLAALLAVGVANLGALIPAAPGYVGTFDAPLVALLTGIFGVSQTDAFGYTLLVHAALLVPVVLLGLLFIWHEGVSLRAVTRTAEPSIVARGAPEQATAGAGEWRHTPR